jgi:hypothetical protein
MGYRMGHSSCRMDTGMNDERMRYMLDVMRASQGGQKIQITPRGPDSDDNWEDDPNPEWNWATMHYRIRPPLPPEPREFWINPEQDTILGEGESPIEIDKQFGWIKIREVLTEEQT